MDVTNKARKRRHYVGSHIIAIVIPRDKGYLFVKMRAQYISEDDGTQGRT